MVYGTQIGSGDTSDEYLGASRGVVTAMCHQIRSECRTLDERLEVGADDDQDVGVK